MNKQNQLNKIIIFIVLACVLKFFFTDQILEQEYNSIVKLGAIIIIFVIGVGFVFQNTTKVIEETTDVLKDRTKLAGGFLQAFGTAFPDMVLGIVAAFLSLQLRDHDYLRAINLAIIAASTTFGSNIYNILHATWCVYRQNMADKKNQIIAMFPGLPFGGNLTPVKKHQVKPSSKELDRAIDILSVLTVLTAAVALSMVLFGTVSNKPDLIDGDLYQLIRPVGIILFVLCIAILFIYRRGEKAESPIQEIVTEERYYAARSNFRIWLDLGLAGVAILFTAESMVTSMEIFSEITGLPFVLTGIAAGLIGCFGEMLVVHNFTVHPKGRIGDAIMGVAMDNIVTTLGASIVAIMGGIFLGGNSLILIFIIILAANTILIQQISKFKNNLPSTIRKAATIKN